MKRFRILWSLAVGAMDAATGFLLVFYPVRILALIHVAPLPPESIALMRWIGTFVFSVGLSYVFALRKGAAAEAVWSFTSLVRLMVAFFLTVMIVEESLPAAWATVAITDGLVAIYQIWGLYEGWWKEDGRDE
jgi:hypothetical protein